MENFSRLDGVLIFFVFIMASLTNTYSLFVGCTPNPNSVIHGDPVEQFSFIDDALVKETSLLKTPTDRFFTVRPLIISNTTPHLLNFALGESTQESVEPLHQRVYSVFYNGRIEGQFTLGGQRKSFSLLPLDARYLPTPFCLVASTLPSGTLQLDSEESDDTLAPYEDLPPVISLSSSFYGGESVMASLRRGHIKPLEWATLNDRSRWGVNCRPLNAGDLFLDLRKTFFSIFNNTRQVYYCSVDFPPSPGFFRTKPLSFVALDPEETTEPLSIVSNCPLEMALYITPSLGATYTEKRVFLLQPFHAQEEVIYLANVV